jgi:hypothetical protein
MSYTVRRRRLSSITRAPCRNVMGVARGAVGDECNVVILDTALEKRQHQRVRPFCPIPALIRCAATVYYRRRPWPCEAMYLSCL